MLNREYIYTANEQQQDGASHQGKDERYFGTDCHVQALDRSKYSIGLCFLFA